LTSYRVDLQYRRATARQAKEISERRLSHRSFFAVEDLSLKYVYILQSEQDAGHFYTGITDDWDDRLSKHNSSEVVHTARYRPWHIKSYVAFSDDTRTFAKKRL
jgi:putative endonuclease